MEDREFMVGEGENEDGLKKKKDECAQTPNTTPAAREAVHRHHIRHQLPERLYLLCRTAGMERLQMRLPGSNGNRVLISRIATPNTLRAEYTKQGGENGEEEGK